jgi:hypothetical protein
MSPSQVNRDAVVSYYAGKIRRRSARKKTALQKYDEEVQSLTHDDTTLQNYITLRKKLENNMPGVLVHGRQLSQPNLPKNIKAEVMMAESARQRQPDPAKSSLTNE